jgi:hypothetical protein
MPVESIVLAKELGEHHQIALLKSIANPIVMTPQERQNLLDGIDLLRSSRVRIDGRELAFVKFFEEFLDRIYTDDFIEKVLRSKSVSVYGQRLKKKIIDEMRGSFVKEGWYRRDLPETRYLIAFCLYSWNAIATGYLFEIEVLQNLKASGLSFQAHDVRNRAERYSPADLTIGEMTGDIKSSTYFFSVARTSSLQHEFYITRYYEKSKRRYHWFVIVRLERWHEIDGEVQPMTFPNWPSNLTKPVSFDFGGASWVAVAYDLWLTKMLAHQKGE